MTWKGRLSWGRRDPVTKTLQNLKKIVAKKDDLKWLSKRMLAKRGDPVGKALAGFDAAHDEEIVCWNFKSPNFGSGSFVRRDGKTGVSCRIAKPSESHVADVAKEHAREECTFSWRRVLLHLAQIQPRQ